MWTVKYETYFLKLNKHEELFYPEYGGSSFHQNIFIYLQDHTSWLTGSQ